MRSPRSLVLAVIGVLIASLVAVPAPVLADPEDGDIDPILDHDFSSALSAPTDLDVDTSATSPTGVGEPPRVGANARVNAAQAAFPAGLLGRSETSIAGMDDGQLLVAGFNDAQGFCGPPLGAACTPQTPSGLSGYGFSTDAGVTWVDGGAPPILNNVFTRGDPWLDRGGLDNATIYYANLAVHQTTGAGLGVSVHRGHFSGGTFAWEDVRTFNAPAAPFDFYDKEAIAAAKDGSGAAYVSVTNFIGLCGQPAFGFGQIEVWRTHDGGDTWQGPSVVGPDITFITNPATPGCGLTGTLQQSSVPAVGPNGEVYVTWQKGPSFTPATSTDAHIMFGRSLDGGLTFSTPVEVAAINSMRQDSPVGYNRDRINDHPRIAAATSGPNRGRIYVTYYSALAPVTAGAVTACLAPLAGSCRAQRLISSQVFVKHSDDQGATWSAALPLAAAPPATGLKRWWPVVSVEPGGNVGVVYYESRETTVASGSFCVVNVGGGLRRRGAAHSLVDTFWARSIDGGVTFEAPIGLSTATTDWCTTVSNIRPNFGDYIGSYSGGDRVLATWADGRNGVPDTFFAAGLGAGKAR